MLPAQQAATQGERDPRARPGTLLCYSVGRGRPGDTAGFSGPNGMLAPRPFPGRVLLGPPTPQGGCSAYPAV